LRVFAAGPAFAALVVFVILVVFVVLEVPGGFRLLGGPDALGGGRGGLGVRDAAHGGEAEDRGPGRHRQSPTVMHRVLLRGSVAQPASTLARPVVDVNRERTFWVGFQKGSVLALCSFP